MKKIISLIFYITCSLIFILEICVANEKAISILAIKNPKEADSNSISRGKMHYMERLSICRCVKVMAMGHQLKALKSYHGILLNLILIPNPKKSLIFGIV